MKPTNVIAIYSRKSRFTGQGESIGNQVELCKDYIRQNYGEITAKRAVIYEDEGFSGGNLDRPAFKKMMKAAGEKKINTIIVYRLDRISRNISDFSGLVEKMTMLGIDFISIKERFETHTPMGRAMMYIASVFSQLERETIAERIRDNMHELAKTGRWLGGVTPTGYGSESVKNITLDGKTKRSCNLKLLPEEAQTVRLIFELFLESQSLSLTEAELMRRCVTTKNNKNFTRFSIKAILQNPVYLIADEAAYHYLREHRADLYAPREAFDGVHGILAYNRTDQGKGRSTVYQPPNEWIVCVGRHPGLISGLEWIEAQKTLERNKVKSYRKPRSNEALLTGLLYCSCGSRMYPKLSQRKDEDGKRVFAYVCHLKEHSQRSRCARPNANGGALDTGVLKEIKNLAEDDRAFIARMEKSKRCDLDNRSGCETSLVGLVAEKQSNEKKIASLVDSLADFGASTAKAPVAQRIEDLQRANRQIKARIEELEEMTSRQTLRETEFDAQLELMRFFGDNLDQMPPEQQRRAARALIRRVVWDGSIAHVVLFGATEDALSAAGFEMPTAKNVAEQQTFADETDEQNAFEEGGDFLPAVFTPWGDDSK